MAAATFLAGDGLRMRLPPRPALEIFRLKRLDMAGSRRMLGPDSPF